MITHIIWDYNGTVVDDVDTAVAAVNAMLKKRGLPPTNKETYKDTLVMPLEKYYSTVGILNADIPSLSVEFREESENNSHLSKIFEGVFEVVSFAKNKGITNILMSSLYCKYLELEVEKYGIRKYFDFIMGMKDTSVGSKYNMAYEYISKNSINPENVLFIGDLISDAQTAKKIGGKCILIPNGHNSKKRCENEGVTVCENLFEITKYL